MTKATPSLMTDFQRANLLLRNKEWEQALHAYHSLWGKSPHLRKLIAWNMAYLLKKAPNDVLGSKVWNLTIKLFREAGLSPKGDFLDIGEKTRRPDPKAILDKHVRPIAEKTLRKTPDERTILESATPKILSPSKRFERLYAQYGGGFAKVAVSEIEEIAFSHESSVKDRTHAYWLLATIAAQATDFISAWQHLSLMRALVPPGSILSPALTKQWRILACDALSELGRPEDVRVLLKQWEAEDPRAPELSLAQANYLRKKLVDEPDSRMHWLGALSTTLVGAGFSPLALDGEDIQLSNLRSHGGKTKDAGLPRVSVLMPAFNATSTLGTAVKSVLNQTWTNLELIIVDDASEDGTFDAASAFAQIDARVRVFRNDINSGAYVSRNRALDAATGEFVMVHDSDDWSHPQRIEYQMHDLLSSGARSNYTFGVRITDQLEVVTKRSNGSMFVMNTSSFMCRTMDIRGLGGWDNARVGADSELIERFEKHYNTRRRPLCRGVSLTFILSRPDSLTQSGATGVSTVGFGARRQYKEFYRYWHDCAQAMPGGKGARWFPIPSSILPTKQLDVCLDVLLISDMTFPGGTTGSNVAMIQAATRAGLRIGVLHWPLIEHAGMDSNRKILATIASTGAAIIVPGQNVNCDVVVVNHPRVLMNIPDALPAVVARAGVVVMNQAPRSRTQNGREVYNLQKVDRNFTKVFGSPPLYAPLSPVIREIAQVLCPPARLLDFDWMPMIDCDAWRRAELFRPGCGSDDVVLIRHARDQVDKWPGSATEIAAAYCADTHIKVMILGGADKAIQTMGRVPPNWSVMPFDATDIPSFLAQGDVYVYYPHDQLIEAFGRAPMEAMAVGLPVLLPPRFKQTFGDSALYVNPEDVTSVVEKLMADDAFYEERVLAGFAYVRSHCTFDLFPRRIEWVLARSMNKIIEPANQG